MSPPTWTTPAQFEFLTSKQLGYWEAKQVGKAALRKFRRAVQQEFFAQWPTQAAEKAERDLLPDQSQVIADFFNTEDGWIQSRRGKIKNWLNNHPYKGKRKRDSDAAAPKVSLSINPVTERIPSEIHMYSKRFYKDRVKAKVEADPEAADPKKWIAVLNKHLAICYEEETEDIKAEIRQARADLKEELDKNMRDLESLMNDEEPAERTPEEYALAIEQLPGVIRAFSQKMKSWTGWSFSTLAGGPDPTKGGEITSIGVHSCENVYGQTFAQATPSYAQNFLMTYSKYLHGVFSQEVRQRRALETSDGDDPASEEECDINDHTRLPTSPLQPCPTPKPSPALKDVTSAHSEKPQPPHQVPSTHGPSPPEETQRIAGQESQNSPREVATSQGAPLLGGMMWTDPAAPPVIPGGQNDPAYWARFRGGDAASGELTQAELFAFMLNMPPLDAPEPDYDTWDFSGINQHLNLVNTHNNEQTMPSPSAMKPFSQTTHNALPDPMEVPPVSNSQAVATNAANTINSRDAPGVTTDNNRSLPPTGDENQDPTEAPIAGARSSRSRRPVQKDVVALTDITGPSSGIPQWRVDAHAYLIKDINSRIWDSLMEDWMRFESENGGVDTSSFRLPGTKLRPSQVSKWAPSRKYNNVPVIADTTAFGNAWINWWNSMQPQWRRTEGEYQMPKPFSSAGPKDNMLSLKRTGPNGLVVVVIALKWWSGVDAADARWQAAVFDMHECIRGFVAGMSKRKVLTEESGPQKKRRMDG